MNATGPSGLHRWSSSVFRALRRVPLFWRFQLVGWAAFEVLSFPAKLAVLGSPTAVLLVTGLRDSVGFALTCGMRFIYRRQYEQGLTLPMAITLVAVVSTIVGAILTVLSLALGRHVALEEHALVGGIATTNMFLFWTNAAVSWSLLYFSIKLLLDAREREVRLAEASAARATAEVRVLRAQMNPHFLFNALNTLREAAHASVERVDAIVDALSGYLRFSLAHRNKDVVNLGAEIDALADYLGVEKARFRDAVEFRFDVGPEARRIAVPAVLLQPLVENAIRHGRETSGVPLRITVSARVEASRLVLEVANTGTWITPSSDCPEHGTALANLRRRLELTYGTAAQLEVTNADGWVTVRISLPANFTL